MEAGRQLILKDFDRIYGALYDVLNQNYRERKVQTAAGEKLLRICRVASWSCFCTISRSTFSGFAMLGDCKST